MDLETMKESVKLPPALIEYLGEREKMLEELSTKVNQTVESNQNPGGNQETSQAGHKPGLCDEDKCELECAKMKQDMFDGTKAYVVTSIEKAARWKGPMAVAALELLQGTLEEWAAAGKPEATNMEQTKEPDEPKEPKEPKELVA